MDLLLATGNKKKIAELAALLAPLGVHLKTPDDVGGLPEVDEDQPTFAGNAAKKAVSAAKASGLWSLADDSGLAVDALGGAPGVHSARWAGTHGDDAANNVKLLAQLAGKARAERGAHFVCCLALADPDGQIACEFEGRAHGHILEQARGERDFGYDPLFLFTEEGFEVTGKAFAELTPAEKSAVSHRGRALQALVKQLPEVMPGMPGSATSGRDGSSTEAPVGRNS
ncbi:MAG: XTP/dITP diphosphohydrolase [Planctomycetota bacterium]